MMMAMLFIACTKEGDTIVIPDPEKTNPSTTPLVTVIYGPNGLGDRAYNDMIYWGVEDAAKEYGLRTLQASPESYEQGIAMLEQLFRELEQTKDTVRRLIIIPESNYGDFLRKNNKRLESSAYHDLLFMETDEPLEGKGSTFYIDYYGAMYMGGSMAQSLYGQKIILFLANPYIKPIVEAAEGFTAGFNDTPPHSEKPSSLRQTYLSDEPTGGFHLTDGEAMQALRQQGFVFTLTVMNNTTIVPICGGSMNSLTRAIRSLMINTDMYIGIDSDQNFYTNYCPYSIVKNIDMVVFDYIGQWLAGEMPKHQRLGLKEGATGVNVGDYDYFSHGETFPDADSLEQVAIRKEAAHAQQ